MIVYSAQNDCPAIKLVHRPAYHVFFTLFLYYLSFSSFYIIIFFDRICFFVVTIGIEPKQVMGLHMDMMKCIFILISFLFNYFFND